MSRTKLLAGSLAIAVPAAVVVPWLAAFYAVAATAYALSWIRARFAPTPYEKPVWWCRLKLEWWAWRAGRRQRADRATAIVIRVWAGGERSDV